MSFFPHCLKNAQISQQHLFLLHAFYLRRYTTRSRQGRPILKGRSSAFSSRFVKSNVRPLDEVIQPQKVPLENHENVEFEGVESKPSRQVISSILDRFYRDPKIKELAETQNITKNIFQKAFQSFRLNCCVGIDFSKNLDPGLQVIFNDIINYDQSINLIYPYFLRHAHKVFPHLERIDELKHISDLTQPHNWYPLAREIHRKIIFHAGPTNSGKTYEALKAFKKAKSGMYCGPLRLLAFEIYERVNKAGIPCDMVTGEQRLFANDPQRPAAHCTFTTEMLPVDDRRDICVIDEIQMLRDNDRGTAWTRALLGVAADEVHLCGEEAAIDLVIRLLDPIGEHVDVRKYERKGELVVIDTHGLRDLKFVEDGDCLIHFSKFLILETARKLKHEYGKESAIIFVIFTTLMDGSGQIFPSYFVKQIAGRAGRFASRHCKGEVMTFLDEDSRLLGRLVSEPIQQISQAGISPSFEAIELFSFHLPHCSLAQLFDIFASISSVSEDFFACSHSRLKEMALLLEHIPLSLKDRYIFCLCPIKDNGSLFLSTAYLQIVRRYSEGNAITINFIKKLLSGEMKVANDLNQLRTLVSVYDILYSYLWLSYRFEEYFPHRDLVRELQTECGHLINESIRLMILKDYSKKLIKQNNINKEVNKKEFDGETDQNEMIEQKAVKKVVGKDVKKGKARVVDFEKNFRLIVSKLKK